jgi:hypothetical protein
MSVADPTTARHTFCPMGPSTGDLLEVRAGMPALASLEQASCFLASLYHMLQDVSEEPHPESIYGAVYLVAMAKAVVDAVAAGLMQQKRGGPEPWHE